MGNFYTGVASFNTTGDKVLTIDLGGNVPNELHITAGPRANTQETYAVLTRGSTDGTRTNSISITPTMSRRTPYTSSTTYLFAVYNSSNVRVFSGTFVSWTNNEITLNVDTCTVSGYSVMIEARSA